MPKKPPMGPRIQCAQCGTWIQSKSEFDWQRCDCGHLWVMGTGDKAQIGGNTRLALLPNGRSLIEEKRRRNLELKQRYGSDDDTKEMPKVKRTPW